MNRTRLHEPIGLRAKKSKNNVMKLNFLEGTRWKPAKEQHHETKLFGGNLLETSTRTTLRSWLFSREPRYPRRPPHGLAGPHPIPFNLGPFSQKHFAQNLQVRTPRSQPKKRADAVAKRYRPWPKGLRADSLPWFDSPLVQGASRLRYTDKAQMQRPGHTGRKALATKKKITTQERP